MNHGCPGKEEWLSLLDGEATENRAAFLRAHAAECSACGRELDLQRQLLADLAEPVPVAQGAVEAILASLPASKPASAKRSRRSWALAGGGLVLAAAAAIVLVPRFTMDRGTFTSRGGEKIPWTQKVGVEVFTVGHSLARLETGTRISPGAALVAGYYNIDSAPAYLMVFGRDARGELHWLYPGFEDAKSDPASVRLEPLQPRRVLPDSVVFDHLPLGSLELVSLITRDPVRVSRVEAIPPAERNPTSLRGRFAGARITSLSVQVVATTPTVKETP